MYRILTLGLLFGLLVHFNSNLLFAAQEPATAPQAPASNIIKKPVQPIQLQPVQTQPVQLQPSMQEPLQVEPLQQPQMPVSPQTETKQPLLKKGQVSFHFDDADIFSVIQTIFGDILKVNYLIDSKVSGKVNFRSVAPVSKEDVLPLMQIILRLNGIGIVEDGGLYRIIPIADIAREPSPVGLGRDFEKVKTVGKALIQIIPVKFIQSSELVKILTPFLSANALIVDVSKTNHVIIADTDANVRRLLQFVDIFDSETVKKTTPQVFVYPVQNSKSKDVANILQQIFLGAKPASTPTTTTPASPTAPKPAVSTVPQQPQVTGISKGAEAIVSEVTKIFPDEIANSLIILATPDDYKIIEETIKKIDTLPRQVMIEALIAEVTLTDELHLGIEWSLRGKIKFDQKQSLSTSTGLNFGNLQGNATTNPVSNAPKLNTFSFMATDAQNAVRTFLSAMAVDNKLNVLASPHILALDNKPAKIQIGEKVPVFSSVSTATTGSGTSPINTSSVQYQDAGVILDVTPQINDGGLISLTIKQTVSTAKTKPIGGVDQYYFVTREFSTNLVVQDGETIVLGGLISEDNTDDRSGLPFLSKIPILGYLFGKTDKTKIRKELIVLLTPYVIKSQQDAKDVSSGYINRTKQINKKDLQKTLAPVEKESANESNGK